MRIEPTLLEKDITTLKPIKLHITQIDDVASLSCRQPLKVAVPFKRAAVHNVSDWVLSNGGNQATVSSVKASSYWPDGSVKWALAKGVFSPEAHCLSDWQLQSCLDVTQECVPSNIHTLQLDETTDGIVVRDGQLSYVFDTSGQQVFPDVFSGEVQAWTGDDFRIITTDVNNGSLEFEKSSLNILAQDEVSIRIGVCGTIPLVSSRRLEVSIQFEILSGGWLRLGVQLHNPHRARHADSLWDLGDDGSTHINGFALCVKRKGTDAIKFRAENEFDWTIPSASKTTLFQASSGGENWDSPNHVDASGQVTCHFKGYRVEADEREIQCGDRASPVVWIDAANGTHWGFKISQYWQNFPKCLSFQESAIVMGLFPAEHGSGYELQGGERKQQEIIFSFSADTDSLAWVDQPLQLTVPAATVVESQVLRYASVDGSQAYSEIIAKSLCADTGFYAKREMIDEYGWRNFGDIYADHETLYHDCDTLFISHYNNQYDPIYGFARQYLLTADQRWYCLMVDLARHVLDIDTYRTEEDRAEYNHGLFWHTNHYKQAYTCTHRTYSCQHYDDWHGEKGGGPSCEHCYTSGLLLYYQLTGDTDARDAIIGFTAWMRHFHEGTGTLLEVCKNIVSIERRKFLLLCQGRKVFRYRYRLNRGTGNYIRTLLDCFEVTGEKSYISETEGVILATFASNDDLVARDLHDAEYTWFYLICLQETIRYLDLKRELGELDTAFCYARNGMLYYARWIAENETPFMSQTERLIYPNDTWVAQDIRKANVLYAAYRYATDDRDVLLTRARYFRDYVLQTLKESDTLHYSRIQILMLQNHGPSDVMDTVAEPYDGLTSLPVLAEPQKSCFYTWPGFIFGILAQLARGVRQFSLAREIKWLKARIG